MDIIRPLHALGMSSGTALDGVDVALLKTDGVDVYDFGLSQSVPYDEELRDKIRSVLGKRPDTPENEAAIREVETELTAFHAEIANEIIAAQDEKVDVIGTSKGKGFQGRIKRWGQRRGPMTHGSHFQRHPGSIGQCAYPARVLKGVKMAGHMGNERVTVKNLSVVRIDAEQNLILVKGAVPGAKNGLVAIRMA